MQFCSKYFLHNSPEADINTSNLLNGLSFRPNLVEFIIVKLLITPSSTHNLQYHMKKNLLINWDIGPSINDVTQIWGFLNPLSHIKMYVLPRLLYVVSKKCVNPHSLVAWHHLWMLPNVQKLVQNWTKQHLVFKLEKILDLSKL